MSTSGEFVAGSNIKYPEVRRGDTVDVYHGIEVPDPYRWLETGSPDREGWLVEQARLLDTHGPSVETVDVIKERFRSYRKSVTESIEDRYDNRRFFDRTTLGTNYSVTFERLADGSERKILDPNTWSEDGSVAPAGEAISPKGNYMAFARSVNDNDQQHWRVMDINTGEVLDDELPQTHHSLAIWLNDETGFFYTRANGDHRSIYFHSVHTSSETDKAIFVPECDDDTWYRVDVSDDQQWLYIEGSPLATGSNYIDALSIDQLDAPAVRLFDVDTGDIYTSVVYNQGKEHLLFTERGAPKGSVVSVSLGESNWTTLIPESSDVLNSVSIASDRLICEYYDGLSQYVKIFDLEGQLLDRIDSPEGVGMVSAARYNYDDPEIVITLESPTTPPTLYTYNVLSGDMQKIKDPDILIDTSNMITEMHYAVSVDGTHIPMFVSRRKDVELNGNNPTILYGYGAAGISELPIYSPLVGGWVDMGGVFVSACPRGGGEFGEDWHAAGKGLQKENTFEDFIACADELIASGITNTVKLASYGGSFGGLLVAACMLRRPHLFGAVLQPCALLDMLRFDKDSSHTTSKSWVTEFGSTDNIDDFENLYGYSPVHNVKPAKYPPVYIPTGAYDDRVLPWHSYKYVAELQLAQLGSAAILLDVEHTSGHSISGVERWYAEIAKQYAFLAETFDMRLDN